MSMSTRFTSSLLRRPSAAKERLSIVWSREAHHLVLFRVMAKTCLPHLPSSARFGMAPGRSIWPAGSRARRAGALLVESLPDAAIACETSAPYRSPAVGNRASAGNVEDGRGFPLRAWSFALSHQQRRVPDARRGVRDRARRAVVHREPLRGTAATPDGIAAFDCDTIVPRRAFSAVRRRLYNHHRPVFSAESGDEFLQHPGFSASRGVSLAARQTSEPGPAPAWQPTPKLTLGTPLNFDPSPNASELARRSALALLRDADHVLPGSTRRPRWTALPARVACVCRASRRVEADVSSPALSLATRASTGSAEPSPAARAPRRFGGSSPRFFAEDLLRDARVRDRRLGSRRRTASDVLDALSRVASMRGFTSRWR